MSNSNLRYGMSKTSYDHDHIYIAVSKSHKQYRCLHPGCTHIITAAHLVGRKAKCHNCGEPLIVDVAMLRNTYITHNGCGREKFMPNLVSEDKPLDVAGLLSKVSI